MNSKIGSLPRIVIVGIILLSIILVGEISHLNREVSPPTPPMLQQPLTPRIVPQQPSNPAPIFPMAPTTTPVKRIVPKMTATPVVPPPLTIEGMTPKLNSSVPDSILPNIDTMEPYATATPRTLKDIKVYPIKGDAAITKYCGGVDATGCMYKGFNVLFLRTDPGKPAGKYIAPRDQSALNEEFLHEMGHIIFDGTPDEEYSQIFDPGNKEQYQRSRYGKTYAEEVAADAFVNYMMNPGSPYIGAQERAFMEKKLKAFGITPPVPKRKAR